MNLYVERGYIDKDAVVKMTLKSNYHLVLGHNAKGPTKYSVDPSLHADGSDGSRPLTCKTMVVMLLPRYIGQVYLSGISPFAGILSHSQQANQESFLSFD